MYLKGLEKTTKNLYLHVPGSPTENLEEPISLYLERLWKMMKNVSLNVPGRAKENNEDVPEYYLNIIHHIFSQQTIFLFCPP
jgi:hypothetical protein